MARKRHRIRPWPFPGFRRPSRLRAFAGILCLGVLAWAASAQEAAKAPPPIPLADVDRLLRRAENNLVLHGLSLDPKYLERATADYRRVLAGMPPGADRDRRLTAHFALAFCIARSDFPADPSAREALVREAADALVEAVRIDPTVPGTAVVEGMLQEQMGDGRTASERITAGLEAMERAGGPGGWQGYQLRFFGLLARCRALLSDATLSREQVALRDAGEALRLAEAALRDPAAPRENRLRRVALAHVAAAQQKMDFFADAERILAGLVREDPDNVLHAYNLGLVLAQQQKFPRALEWYRRAADLAPSDPRPRLKIGYILLVHPPPGGEPDAAGAEREAQAYLATSGSRDAEYAAMRGEAAWVRGDRKEAERWFRESLSLSPQGRPCIHALNRLLQILGSDEAPTPERDREVLEIKERLQKAIEERNRGGGGMGTEKTDLTFCRESWRSVPAAG